MQRVGFMGYIRHEKSYSTDTLTDAIYNFNNNDSGNNGVIFMTSFIGDNLRIKKYSFISFFIYVFG
jgi:hypothetical protein